MILDKVFNLDRTVVVTGAGLDQDATLKRVFGTGPKVHSGVEVTDKTAMTVSGWYAGVRLLSWTTAYLPLFVYERQANGDREQAPNHVNFRLLHNRPNPIQNSMIYRETGMMHIILQGNAYSYIQPDGAGRPMALWQLEPSKVKVKLVNGRLQYELTDIEDLPLDRKVLLDNEVIHVPGLGFNGVVGMSVVSFARESIGENIAAGQFAGGFYASGAQQNIALEHPAKLQEGTAERLRSQWKDKHDNPNSGPAVLEEGMAVSAYGIPQKDMQYIESRKFGVNEAARWLGLQPHKIGDMEAATFSNIAEQNIEFTQALLPWMRRFEQEYDFKLFNEAERSRFFVEHVVEGLLAGDPEARANGFATALQNGYMNRNEVRRLNNMNSMGDEGDVFTVQMNLTPLEKLGEEPEPEPELEPSEEPPEEEPTDEPTEDQDSEREAVVASAKASLLDALKRMIHKQCADLRRCLEKHPEQFVTRMTKLHDAFDDKMTAGITPACDVCRGVGLDVQPARIVPSYLLSTHSALLDLSEYPLSETDAMQTGIRAKLSTWEDDGANDLLKTLFGDNHE